MVAFRKAVKVEAKLRLALAGPSGAGKTYTALTLATALAGDKPVALIDTEKGSASKYADLFAFDVLELDDFDPDRYVEAINAAVAEGYGVVVIDSLTHAWNGKSGLLEQVERVAKLRHGGNTFKAWGDHEIRRKESALIAALTGSPLHIIGTMRTKTEYVVETNDRGKATPRKVGTAPIQRDGLEYEFDIVGELTPDNELIVQKTRCPALAGAVIAKPGRPLAETLRAWLGGAPAPVATPALEVVRPVEESPDEAIKRRIAEGRAMAANVPLGKAQASVTERIPLAPAEQGPEAVDPWAEIREIADALNLSDEQRAELKKRHKGSREKILAELRERQTKADSEPDITFSEPEPATGLEDLDFGQRGN